MSDEIVSWLRDLANDDARYVHDIMVDGKDIDRFAAVADELERLRSLVSSYEQRLEAARKAWTEANAALTTEEADAATTRLLDALSGARTDDLKTDDLKWADKEIERLHHA